MHDNRTITEARLNRFLDQALPLHRDLESTPLTLTAWQVPGEPIPPAEAIAHEAAGDYAPIHVGDPIARAWGTKWIHVVGTVPAEWDDPDDENEIEVDFGFTNSPGFQGEGLFFRPDGTTVKAINPLNNYLSVSAGEEIDLYLECAANPGIEGSWATGPTPLGDPDTLPEEPLYYLHRLELVRRSKEVRELLADLRALGGLMYSLPETSERRADILRTAEDALDVADFDDLRGTAPAARAILKKALDRPAASSALTVLATGHAHIDSAWLWPLRETVRKCARTFSNVCWLLERYPELTFSCSSAQQYAWIEEFYPELFERIKKFVAEGRFIPVGGMWVESDTNMPGSEAMTRQFVQGKRYFLSRFGVETKNTWLPDSFGYSGALPQIAALAGHEFFLTQKVSWNQYNDFPHHTFEWEGIDGTTQFTHFPPIDTYNGQLTGQELAYFESNFKEKGRSSIGLSPIGWGDGGGGPTREHVEAAKRTADLEGSPKVEWGTPDDFFTRARDEYTEIQRWCGELYLELHRGTYSSQIRTKQGNRRNESLLRQAEQFAAEAAVRAPGYEYPQAELDELWQMVLLLQFHDILPGSGIAWVAKDAEHNHAAVSKRAEAIIESALDALAGSGEGSGEPASTVTVSTIPAEVDGVPALGASTSGGRTGSIRAVSAVTGSDGRVTVDNGALHAVINGAGHLVSLVDNRSGREAIAPGSEAGALLLHRDTPNHWDAWDIDEHYRRVVRELVPEAEPKISEHEDGSVHVISLVWTGLSAIEQTYVFRPGSPAVDIQLDIDWHERRKALKLAFPLDVRAAEMSSEVQYGYVNRDIPENTSWDHARFETCAHRWVRVGEPGYGVALANDSTYGHDVLRTLRAEDHGTTTTVRHTIIRSPEYPDPRADEGRHLVRVSIRPGASLSESIDEGYRLNLPLRAVEAPSADAFAPLVAVDAASIRVEAVKLADDGSGDLIVRLYESEGARATATLTADASVGASGWQTTDLLERPFAADVEGAADLIAAGDGAEAPLSFRPFQIRTVRFARA